MFFIINCVTKFDLAAFFRIYLKLKYSDLNADVKSEV
jgi:hypothetical protein